MLRSPCTRNALKHLASRRRLSTTVNLHFTHQFPPDKNKTDGAIVILHGLLCASIRLLFGCVYIRQETAALHATGALTRAPLHKISSGRCMLWCGLPVRIQGMLLIHGDQDLRNHGASPHVEPMTYTSMADDVAQFIRTHGLRDVSVIGHSMFVLPSPLHPQFNPPA